MPRARIGTLLALALFTAATAVAEPKPLRPDEGVLAFVVDSAHGLTSLQFVREDQSGSFRVAGKVAAGKTPVFIRLDAGRYCLYGFSIEGGEWTMNSRDGLCWDVAPGKVAYRATLQPRQFRSALDGAFGAASNSAVNNQVLDLHDPKTFVELMRVAPAPEWTTFPHDDASLVEDVEHNAKVLQRVGSSLRWSRIYDGAARLFEASFRLGRPYAATLRGDFDRLGQGRRKDAAAAAGWYLKAAEAGDTRGAALYCQALDLGLAGTRDAVEAVRWCKRAADGGDALGQYWLSRLMARGAGGLAPDAAEQARLVTAAEAFRAYDPAREHYPREPDAKAEDHAEKVADLVRRSFGFKAVDDTYPDAQEALRVALIESEDGLAAGASRAAFYTAKGIGTAPDWPKAEQLYLRAARIGNDPDAFSAYNTLAHAFWEAKDGFPRNTAKAAQYFETMAVKGGDLGRANLAWFLATVDDAELRDPKRAKQMIERVLRHNSGEPYGLIDTLAAVHAASGDFENARREQERALAKALKVGADQKTIDEFEQRLTKYEKGIPELR